MRGKQLIDWMDSLISAGCGTDEVRAAVLSATSIQRTSVHRLLSRNDRLDLYKVLFPPQELRGCGTTTAYIRGCRCEDCTTANRERQVKIRADYASRPKDPNDPRHGTPAFYRNHSCRCELCSAAHSEACTKAYQRRLAQPIDPNDPRHGKHSFYSAYGCRCEPCRAASSLSKRRKP